MLSTLLRDCINFILPPRRTQGLVDALQLRDLEQLQTTIGLHYHAEEERGEISVSALTRRASETVLKNMGCNLFWCFPRK